MDVSISIFRLGIGPQDFLINIYQDAPQWKHSGTSSRDLPMHEVMEILEQLGLTHEEVERELEQLPDPIGRRTIQRRLTDAQVRWIQNNFPPGL